MEDLSCECPRWVFLFGVLRDLVIFRFVELSCFAYNMFVFTRRKKGCVCVVFLYMLCCYS
jgi:hypothetical protein